MDVKLITDSMVPSVVFPRDVYVEMMAYCRATNIELGWAGLIEKKDGENGKRVYTVTRAFLPPQKLATAGTCEFMMDAFTEFLVDNDMGDDMGKTKFWAHSHHTMGVTASGQDVSCSDELYNHSTATADDKWCVTAIFNHRGEINLTCYDGRYHIKFMNVPFYVGDNAAAYNEKIALLKTVLPNHDEAAIKAMVEAEERKSLEASIVLKVKEVQDEVDKVVAAGKPPLVNTQYSGYGNQYGTAYQPKGRYAADGDLDDVWDGRYGGRGKAGKAAKGGKKPEKAAVADPIAQQDMLDSVQMAMNSRELVWAGSEGYYGD